MELIAWFILPLAVALSVLGFMIGAPVGRKLGGNWAAGIALGTLLAILPLAALFSALRLGIVWRNV